ncbi:MAG: 50S ribosomal protein L24 [Thermoplasmata archaeon]|nr:MAG: 50S ribosomal protein L24 [Thermoplasmata archaeon]
MNSIQPRKQRKNLYNAPLHKQRKWLASHLAEDLMLKYNKRSVPVVRGDTVKVVRGNFKNHVDKVREVDLVKQVIEVEGVVTTKVDGSKVPRPIHPSNVIITKLNLTDPRRREKLERGLSEEAKKEIEMEAKRQIEEERLEEERRKEEEARKAAEAKEAQEEPEEQQAKQPEEKAAEEAVEEPEGKPEKVEEVKEKTEEEPGEAESKEEPEPVEEPKKAEEEQVEEEAEGKKKDGGAAEDLNNKDIEG